MNVTDIIRAYLEQNGYDGLYSPWSDCACLLDDLAPCGELGGRCEPGIEVPCDCGDHDVHVVRRQKDDDAR